MVRYVKNEGRPALGFAVESEESDESSDDELLSDQPSLATLVMSGVLEGSTADTTLDSVLDQDFWALNNRRARVCYSGGQLVV